jgi:hypothetical protein
MVASDGLDDRHRGFRLADQEEKRGRTTPDELGAYGRRVERASVDVDDGAAARGYVLPQDPSARRPIDAWLRCQGNPTVARTQEEVCVDAPAVGLRRREARDPVRRVLGERVQIR